MKRIYVLVIAFLFSNGILYAENEKHRTFFELGWVQPYGIHFGFGISYFYGGLNVFWEKDSITLTKKYYEYYLLGDGSIDKTRNPQYLKDMDEEINTFGQSVWVQIPLGVTFDVVKKSRFSFSVRQAWIISIINIVYDKELYRPDLVFEDKQTTVEKSISHLFWRDRGLDLLSDRKMYHAFYPLCFETSFQFVFDNFWNLSLGVILDTGRIEKSRAIVSFGISNPFR